ncbi:MAG: Uncharacterised protein [Flavobacterium sp. SCGC AAA160-P02]|nr:MAG: Uncharacterised protein [Flavobacterium sp. SCGC AAA160-P02]
MQNIKIPWPFYRMRFTIQMYKIFVNCDPIKTISKDIKYEKISVFIRHRFILRLF